MFVSFNLSTRMSATKLTAFLKFHIKSLRLSGYQFFTYDIDKHGKVLSKFKIFDFILFLLSFGFSLHFAIFDKFELNLDSLVNSNMIQGVVDHYVTFGSIVAILLKLSSLCLHKKFLALMHEIKICHNFVSLLDF